MASPSVPAPTPDVGAAGRRFRGPAVLNGVVLAVVVALVAAIALPASQTPPPTIAEFAPQATEQITDAPPEQSSDLGLGEGGGEGGAGVTTTTSSTTTSTSPPVTNETGARVIDRARVRRCVGNPPRQTEDPQSPPCLPYFEGDNGGATWKGVTANEVRIAVPANGGFMKELFAHFNARYEFYGRKLVPVTTGAPGSVEGMVSQAIKADVEHKVFASTLYGDASGREYVYYDELARRGIVSTNARPSEVDEAHLAKFHPHQWSYLPTFDVMSRNKAEWICKALAGKAPEFAGGTERVASVRKFGLMRTIAQDGSGPDVEPMIDILEGCGIDIAVKYDFVKYEPTDDQAGIRQAQDAVLKFQSAQVTSIICECHTQAAGFYSSPVFTKQSYFPEWLISTYMYVAEDSHVQFNEGQQQNHSFGLGWWDKQIAPEQSPWYMAVKDGDPNREFANHFDYFDARWLYNSLRILAAGIQMAGPNLTPTTFAEGLRRARFSNPNPGQPPYWQAGVSLGNKHSFVEDAALVWLSKEQPSSWGNVPGAVCYAQRGKRYRLGTWPSDNAGLFQLPCY